MNRSPRYRALAITLLVAAYIGLRLTHLGDGCLWFDEIFSVHAAEHSWSDILKFVSLDLIHPPLFYVLLKGWIGIGGESVLWLRTFPLLFALLALVPFYLLTQELKLSSTAAAVAGILFVANGSLIKYSAEVRMYSPLLFFSVTSIWLFSRFFFRGKNIWVLTAVNILLVYTHYFGWWIILAEAAAILVFQRMKIRHILIMFAITLVTYVPWVWAVLRASSDGAALSQNIGWMERPSLYSLIGLGFALLEPAYAQMTSIQPRSIYILTIPLLLLVGAVKIFYLSDRGRGSADPAVGLLSVLTALPVVSAFLVSWALPVSVWGTRHLIIVFAPVFLLIGIFFGDLPQTWLKRAAVCSLGLFVILGVLRQSLTDKPEFVWCGWNNAITSMQMSDTETIYAVEDLVAYHVWFPRRSLPNTKVGKLEGVPDITEDPAYFLPRGFDSVTRVRAEDLDDQRFWLAFRGKGAETSQPPLNYFLSRGYAVKQFLESPADGERAFLVELEKQN